MRKSQSKQNQIYYDTDSLGGINHLCSKNLQSLSLC